VGCTRNFPRSASLSGSIIGIMLQFLGNAEIWHTLRGISRHRKVPLYVAVPFLGNEGGKLLYLRRGDVLVVALTLANCRNGSVCPAEIERLQAKGVRVYLVSNLHAKVLVCGRKAVVGSANLSRTSYRFLDEAATLTTDSSVVSSVREWFRQRMSEPVTPAWLSVCAKAYRPPKGGIGTRGPQKITRSAGSRVWLLDLSLIDYPEDEATVFERGGVEARQELSDPANCEVVPVRLVGNSAIAARISPGDTVIQIVENSGSRKVEEVARFIRKRRTKSKRGAVVTYLYLECRRRPKTVKWVVFKRQCRSVGLKLRPRTRELTNPTQAARAVGLLPRRRG
jgi:hypothetical protein